MGAFGGSKAVSGLRAIASRYPEAGHVVVRKDSPIRSIKGLQGKRVSIDLKGSGTRAVAMLVLKGIGIDAASLRQLNSQIGPAVDRLKSGRLDAFFFVGGFPAPSIRSSLAAAAAYRWPGPRH
jgi:TRAP transporter TAXI family solute receptor